MTTHRSAAGPRSLRPGTRNQEPGTGSAGFTLVEILIALFILATGLVGIWSLFPVSINCVARDQGVLVSSNFAKTKFALVQRRPDLVNSMLTATTQTVKQYGFFDASGKLVRAKFLLPEAGDTDPPALEAGESSRREIHPGYRYTVKTAHNNDMIWDEQDQFSYTNAVGSPATTRIMRITVTWGSGERLQWTYYGLISDTGATNNAFY